MSEARHANTAVELDAERRPRDPDHATLTLQLRDAGDRERALVVAGELAEHGHVDRVAARHSGADDAGRGARSPGGDAAFGEEPGGGDDYRAGGRGAECGTRDWDLEVLNWRAFNKEKLG